MAETASTLEMSGGTGRVVTLSTSEARPVPPALVASNETVNVPAVAGTPDNTPAAASRLSQTGRPVAPKRVGLLLATIR